MTQKENDTGAGDAFDPSAMQQDTTGDAAEGTPAPVEAPYKPRLGMGGRMGGWSPGGSGGGFGGGFGGGNAGAGLPSDRYTNTRIEAEEQRYRSHTALSVWLIKFAALSMGFLILALLGFFGYITTVTQSLPDMGVFGQFFGGLVQVLSTIFSLGSR